MSYLVDLYNGTLAAHASVTDPTERQRLGLTLRNVYDQLSTEVRSAQSSTTTYAQKLIG